jgi:hypothetical protein
MVSSVTCTHLLLPLFTTLLHKSDTRKVISWSVTVYNKTLSSQYNLTAKIEPVQDKLIL